MAYKGGSLLSLVGSRNTAGPTRRMLRRATTRAGAEMTRRAAANTPIGRTGSLARKWERLPTRRVPEGYESGTANPDHRALWIEHGVEPHEIEPRRQGDDDPEALSVPGVGEPRGSVDHPGFRGRYPLARAAAEVEADFERLAQPYLSAWAREIERGGSDHR